MSTCDACKALLGASTTVEPHMALRMRDSILRDYGELEKYRCRACGTLWDRFKTDLTFRGEPQRWKTNERPRLYTAAFAPATPAHAKVMPQRG